MSTLVVVEHRQGELRDVSLELLGAARTLPGPVTVALIANDPATLVDAVNVAGVDELLVVRVAQREFESDIYQAVVEMLIADRQPRVTLLGFTVNSQSYGPALAAKLDLGFASDVFAVRHDGDVLVAERAFYGGKVHAELEFPSAAGVILLLRPGTWAPVNESGAAQITEVAAPASLGSRAGHVRFVERPQARVDIGARDFLLSVGRGIGEADELPRLSELATKMGAILTASRPLVDAGWIDSERLVGQSGSTVKPKVYLALGISGAVQHLAGMKQSGTIIAVNSDSDAAIFNVAHYAAVTDLFEVVEELEKLY